MQALAQIVPQATLHTICEICNPILLFGTIRLLGTQEYMLTWPTLMACSLSPGGWPNVLLLHSFRSKATSWVTPTPVMSSFICWCHVFLVLGTSSSSGTWYCQLHHSAGDVVYISSLDMFKPVKTATAHNLVDR